MFEKKWFVTQKFSRVVVNTQLQHAFPPNDGLLNRARGPADVLAHTR
ncbi:MAG: hypothetical protein OJF52_003126 [Nitrospira sp.]|nr:MAG: hypothetical protein OJF52_003126 [Nitrospira sp.]